MNEDKGRRRLLDFRIRDSICVTLVIGCLTCFDAGCSPVNPPKVTFILPNGYKGPFVIVEAPGGTDAAFSSSDTTVVVPTSGIAVVDSASFLQEMSVHKARFTDGRSLSTGSDGEYSDDTAMLRGGRYSATSTPNSANCRYEFFVGTQDEFEDFDFDAWLKERPYAVRSP